jgi:formamidopyrimidine-DNA glycosylase
MPELPEVETVRRTLESVIQGDEIIAVDCIYSKLITSDLEAFKKNIIHQKIIRIDRMGKYLIFILTDYAMIIHLRMEGKFFIKKDEQIMKHEHVIFHLKSGKTLRYHDVRKFGTITLHSLSDYLTIYPLSELGKEPKDLNIESFYQAIHKKGIAIKSALLDQHIISGLGNIYVDETLFLSKIHPERPASAITKKEAESLLDSAKKVLSKAVELGGTTIRSYTSSLGVSGRFQNELNVHMRKGEPCPICQTPIIKLKVGGRGTYVCPKCQR